ncbi:MAG: hypothetical protein JKX68_13350 [Flavobacteriales bacterium]|nr:hypothetical protein [Flavobacteriales bacterium]
MKKTFLIVGFLVSLSTQVNAQSFHIDFLFHPGATVGAEYLFPSAINDSVDFQLTKYKFQVTQPLKTKFGIDLKGFNFKKMDAKASQVFLSYNLSVTQPSVTDNGFYENIYTGGFGITAITASIRKGIWLYSANVFASENSTTLKENFTPNARGYIANVKIKNLKFIYFYGGGLLFFEGKLYPFPVLGFRAKLSSKLRAELVLPISAKINYKVNKKLNLDLATAFSGINAIFREGSALQGDDNTMIFSRLKTYFGVNAKLGKQYKIKTELGYSMLQRIDGLSIGYTQNIDPSPYISVSINYNFGKSVFGDFVNRVE